MANPGPATTVANHPQVLGSNQALRLLASAQSVSLAVTGDTVLPVLNSSSSSAWRKRHRNRRECNAECFDQLGGGVAANCGIYGGADGSERIL